MNLFINYGISIISIIYLFFIIRLKNNRKLKKFICDYLNVFLILILVLLIYSENKDLGIIFFILFFYTKFFLKDF